MKLRKLLAMTLVVAMIGALAAGCGSKSEETGAEGEGEQQTAEWDASNDITVVSREDGSGTRGAFIELFGIEQKDENGNKVTETIVTHHDSAGKTAAQGTVGCLLVIVAIIVFFILFIISKA